jgi:hypothetical protein
LLDGVGALFDEVAGFLLRGGGTDLAVDLGGGGFRGEDAREGASVVAELLDGRRGRDDVVVDGAPAREGSGAGVAADKEQEEERARREC